MFYIQLIGILGFCVLVLSFYKKNTRTILMYQVVSNFVYSVHYFLLGALSGTFISVVGIFRNIFFLKMKKNKWILVAIVISIYLLITIVFYENIYSIFPMIANSIYLIMMLRDVKKDLLIASIISSILWMIYAIFVSSYASVITESILLISNTVQLVKLPKKSR